MTVRGAVGQAVRRFGHGSWLLGPHRRRGRGLGLGGAEGREQVLRSHIQAWLVRSGSSRLFASRLLAGGFGRHCRLGRWSRNTGRIGADRQAVRTRWWWVGEKFFVRNLQARQRSEIVSETTLLFIGMFPTSSTVTLCDSSACCFMSFSAGVMPSPAELLPLAMVWVSILVMKLKGTGVR